MNHRTNRVVRSNCRGRATTVLGLAAALLAPGLGAATLSGRLTQCHGEPAPNMVVMAYEVLQVGIQGPRGCIRGIAERVVRVGGSTVSLADGSFGLPYVPAQPEPQDCSFESAGVYVEITTEWGFARSPTRPRSASGETVFEDLELGFGKDCPELGVTFSLEGPSVVTGPPGETVSFDVFVVLGAQDLGSQIVNVESWVSFVTADGASVVGATTNGTAAAPTDADPPGLVSPCRQEWTEVQPESPPPDLATAECPSQPVAQGLMILWRCPTNVYYEALPLGQGTAYRILRVTLEATIPLPGLETSCRVYFRDRCPLPVVILQNIWTSNGELELPRLLDLEVKLLAQTTGTPFRRGDTNDSGTVDISDAVGTFNYLFLGAAAPSCKDAADSNADGILDISDGVNTLAYLFGGTSEIPAPGAKDCGAVLPAEPGIGCELQRSCD
jgi:hypothetical protein